MLEVVHNINRVKSNTFAPDEDALVKRITDESYSINTMFWENDKLFDHVKSCP